MPDRVPAGQGETAEQTIDLDRLRRQVMSTEEAAEVADSVERLLVRVQEADERAENGEGFRQSMYALESRVQELTDERDALAIRCAELARDIREST